MVFHPALEPMEVKSPQVVSAHEVDPEALRDFFHEMFPGRATATMWSWLNRSTFFESRTPLALVQDGRVLAFSGMIPFRATIDHDATVAAWFVDFAVRPGLQRRGLGSELVPSWTSFPDAGLGFPNELSIGTARKIGWHEDESVRLLFFPLRPLEHPRVKASVPRLFHKGFNGISASWCIRRYRRYSSGASRLIRPLEHGDLEVLASASAPPQKGHFIPLRDVEYLGWRLWDSPERDAYRFIRSGEACGVLKHRRKEGARGVDLLLVEGAKTPEDEIQLISDVALWAAKEGCSFMRQLACDPERTATIKARLGATARLRPLVFHSSNRDLNERLLQAKWRWQLLDSDFERFGESLA